MKFLDKAVIPGIPGYHDIIEAQEYLNNLYTDMGDMNPSYVMYGGDLYKSTQLATATENFSWMIGEPVVQKPVVIPFSSTSDISQLMSHQNTIRAIELESLRPSSDDEILNIPLYPSDNTFTRGFKVMMNEKGMCLPKYRDRIGPSFPNDVRCILKKPEIKNGEQQSTAITFKMTDKFCTACDVGWMIQYFNTSPDVANPLKEKITIYSDGRIYIGDKLYEGGES